MLLHFKSVHQVKGLLGVVIEHKSHLHLGAVNSWIDVFTYIHTYK